MSLNFDHSNKTNFQLVLNEIPIFDENEIISYKKLTLNIFETVAPGIEISQLEENFLGGKTFLEGGELSFNSFNIKFLVDDEMENWIDIFNWMTTIHDQVTRMGAPRDQYETSMSLMIFDNWGNTKRRFNFQYVWPIKLNDIELSFQDDAPILKSGATLSYDYYKVDSS